MNRSGISITAEQKAGNNEHIHYMGTKQNHTKSIRIVNLVTELCLPQLAGLPTQKAGITASYEYVHVSIHLLHTRIASQFDCIYSVIGIVRWLNSVVVFAKTLFWSPC